MGLTAARVVGAIMLAGLGWLVSDLIRPLMPESTIFGWFNYVNLGLGWIVGWSMLGPKAGSGMMAALGNGVTVAFAMGFLGLFTQAVNEMLRLSTRKMYAGPMKAIEDLFRIMAEFGQVLLHPTVIGPLIIGAVVIAVLVEMANSVWR
ncbi:TrgA family protein [Thalassobius sp. MITS945101]|uniref:TrgA family protein n=1 Tax=Thalassobius sp. MITS945101 TaxID=3096994 RepID=UPI00399A759A